MKRKREFSPAEASADTSIHDSTHDSAHAWSARGSAYATSAVHKSGPSLVKLLALARPHPGDSCLDLGTGAGHTAAALAARAEHVVGLDVSAGMVRTAQATYGGVGNLEFVVAPAHDTGLSPDFDLITARHTLHHHTDLAATLREAARLLKPGRRLVIADEVTPDSEVDAWYDAVERARDPTHVRAYKVGEWRDFVAAAGLTWIVGDSDTRYSIDVASWLERMNPDAEATRTVYTLFEAADAHARDVFGIEYGSGRAVRFQLPVALILAVKPT